jgi:dolichol-phosphate mannosyltransferase
MRHETLRPGGLVVAASHPVVAPQEGSITFAPSDRFLVVMPTYNERDNLPRIVPLVLDEDPRIELLVVDDGSPDGTGQLADELARAEPRVHVLHRSAKDGLGRAYVAGFRWALERSYRLVCEMDADLSHHPDNLPTFIAAARTADVVVGSRYVGGRVNVVNWPMSRLFISLFGSFYARTITGLPVRDATGGFNCFRREVLEAIDLGRVQSNGYAFQIELKLRAFRKGFQLIEIPIVFTERESGESKMSKRIVREAVWRVWWLRFQQLTGRL